MYMSEIIFRQILPLLFCKKLRSLSFVHYDHIHVSLWWISMNIVHLF